MRVRSRRMAGQRVAFHSLAARAVLPACAMGAVLLAMLPAVAQDRQQVATLTLSLAEVRRVEQLALGIWSSPELGYLEDRTSETLQTQLREAGFAIDTGVAGMPTAFVARNGRGRPVVAILAEMDALPGMSQAVVPERAVLVDANLPGHACGHNLFGAASVGAALAISGWLAQSGTAGEIRLYGTPAEEGGSGKAYMVAAGLFDDVDVVLHWHPADVNDASQSTSMANVNGRFVFQGLSAHASIAPERGRSALDGVETLNFMANLMREHVPEGTRIHYTINDGGGAPNVVPARASAHYYVRHAAPAVVRDVAEQLKLAATGAAMGTGTQVHFEPLGGVYSLLPNHTLGRLIHDVMQRTGGPGIEDAALAYAEAIRGTLEMPGALTGMSAIRPISVMPTPQHPRMWGMSVGWCLPQVFRSQPGYRERRLIPGRQLRLQDTQSACAARPVPRTSLQRRHGDFIRSQKCWRLRGPSFARRDRQAFRTVASPVEMRHHWTTVAP